MTQQLKGRIAKLETLLKPDPKREPGVVLFAKDDQTNAECIAEYMALHCLTERPKGKIIIFQGYKGEW